MIHFFFVEICGIDLLECKYQAVFKLALPIIQLRKKISWILGGRLLNSLPKSPFALSMEEAVIG